MAQDFYTVARQDGEEREFNLTLADAAHCILTHDGCDYEVRPRADGEGFEIWSRQQVAGRGWTQTQWFSLEDDRAAAEADLRRRVVDDSGTGNWRGLIAEPQDAYRQSMLDMLQCEDDEETIRDILAQHGEILSDVVVIDGRITDYDAAVNVMDDDIREALHDKLAPCTKQEFMDAYVKAHAEKFGKDFATS